MRKFLIPSKDTTIYQSYPTNNAGLDEILEIGKVLSTTENLVSYATASARALLYFELPEANSVPNSAKYFLNLKLANASDIHRNQKIVVYYVSKSWDEGSGYFYQQPKNVNDGATWRQTSTNISWSIYGGDVTSTENTSSIRLTDYPIQDIRIDVTNILQPIVSQSLQETFHGLLLQFPVADEENSDNKGNIKVFSSQTHTIHQPTLEIAWDSQTHITGNLQKMSSMDVKIVCNNLKEYYEKGDVSRVSLTVRDKYPLKSFDSTLRYKNKYYLPTSSYYSIVDTQSNITIVPFDDYSKINCDANGSYIDLDTTPLYKGRFYTLKFKIESGSYSRTVNSEVLFKIL